MLAGLPSQRLATLYLARPAAGFLRSIDPTVTSAAAAADVDGDTMRIRAHVRHEGEPGRCAAIAGDDLVDLADPEAALYVEVPSISCALRALAARSKDVSAALAALRADRPGAQGAFRSRRSCCRCSITAAR